MPPSPSTANSPSITMVSTRKAKHGAHDQRITLGPIVAAARAQEDAVASALGDQPVSVVLDLVNPARARGRRYSSRRKAR